MYQNNYLLDEMVDADLLGSLISSGIKCMVNLKHDKVCICYTIWADNLREEFLNKGVEVTERRLYWAWDALREEQEIIRRFGKLPTAGVPWNDGRERFHVLNKGDKFLVALKQAQLFTLTTYPKNNPRDETVVVTLNDELNMRPGKAGRLECCPVKSEVAIRVQNPHSDQREADIMRIDPDAVKIKDKVIIVQVDSLNQAYTVASRRLEPKRRSHGGRTYDRFLYVQGKDRIPLEHIRIRVESGNWEVPPSLVQNNKKQVSTKVVLDY